MVDTVLIISGGIESVPGIIRAKELGYHVVVADGNPNAPGFKFADNFIVCSTYQATEMANAAEYFHNTIRFINGVISIASDVPITVSTVSKRLSLIGHNLSTALMSSDKILMKERFVEKNIKCPWFSIVYNLDHLKSLVRTKKCKFVIKPVDSRGSRGVLLINEESDLEFSYKHAVENSPTKRVMLEEYLEGPQISTEAILLENDASCPGFCDRNYEMIEKTKPFIIENGGEQPSILSENDQEAIRKITIEAGRSLGVTSGTVKGDIVLTPTGPKVIEIATRLSGGWFCTDQIPLATGVDFVGIAIRIALGETIDQSEIRPQFQQGVAVRYFFPPPGRIKYIKNVQKAKSLKGIHKIIIFATAGDEIRSVSNHTQRTGFVLSIGKNNQDAISIAQKAIEIVEFEYYD